MIAGVLEDHVVVAADIKHIKMRIVDLPVAVPGTEGFGDGARRVTIQDSLLQQFGCLDNTDVLALDDLVADTPADDAGVVAIAQHHGVDVLTVTGVNDG